MNVTVQVGLNKWWQCVIMQTTHITFRLDLIVFSDKKVLISHVFKLPFSGSHTVCE
jgi:hypothetical protein